MALFTWAQQPTYKDQGEVDLGTQLNAEKDATKQLAIIAKWEQQYPESALKDIRSRYKLQALTTVALGAVGKTDAASLDPAQKAAQEVADKIDTYFGAAIKPAQVAEAQWTAARKDTEYKMHYVLAYVAGVKKDDATAEAEYKKCLGLDPTQATISYQLGTTIIREANAAKKTDRYSEAFYHIGRAVSTTGAGAMAAAGKTAAENYLKKAYEGYHGDDSGLDELKKTAAAGPALPPANFHVKSIVEVEEDQQKNHEQWAKDHPDLALWENVRENLKTQGDAFFDANVKEAALPSGDVKMFKAKVVSQPSPKELLVNVMDQAGDATLKFDVEVKGPIEPGTSIEFKGVASGYTKAPYNLAFTIDEPKDDVTGLPEGSFAAPKPGPKAGPKAAPKGGAAPAAAPKADDKKPAAPPAPKTSSINRGFRTVSFVR